MPRACAAHHLCALIRHPLVPTNTACCPWEDGDGAGIRAGVLSYSAPPASCPALCSCRCQMVTQPPWQEKGWTRRGPGRPRARCRKVHRSPGSLEWPWPSHDAFHGVGSQECRPAAGQCLRGWFRQATHARGASRGRDLWPALPGPPAPCQDCLTRPSRCASTPARRHCPGPAAHRTIGPRPATRPTACACSSAPSTTTAAWP